MPEIHFVSPGAGDYWVAIDTPTSATRAGYPADTIEVPPRPSVDHLWQDGGWVYVAPPPPDLAPLRHGMRLSRRQLLIGLTAMGWITEAEAEAAATGGVMPGAIEAAVAQAVDRGDLPAEAVFASRITWATMSEAQRLDPLVALLAVAQDVSDAEVDDFFTTFAQI